jgi:hypothetical protein
LPAVFIFKSACAAALMQYAFLSCSTGRLSKAKLYQDMGLYIFFLSNQKYINFATT